MVRRAPRCELCVALPDRLSSIHDGSTGRGTSWTSTRSSAAPVLDWRGSGCRSTFPSGNSCRPRPLEYDEGGASGRTGLRLRIDVDSATVGARVGRRCASRTFRQAYSPGRSGPASGSTASGRIWSSGEAQEPRALYTAQYGNVEVRARALADARVLCAFWLIGFEDTPERSAEICVMEVFGRDVDARMTKVGVGVHPFGDPSIEDDFEKVALPIDAREAHTYSAEWLPDKVRFFVDDSVVKVVDQAPDYAMQLMLNIYEFPAGGSQRRTGRVPEGVRGRLGPSLAATGRLTTGPTNVTRTS